jgi:hypothetical protein
MTMKKKVGRKTKQILKKARASSASASLDDRINGLANIVGMGSGYIPPSLGFKKGPHYAVRSNRCKFCLMRRDAIAALWPERLAELTDPKAATRPADEACPTNENVQCRPCVKEWEGLLVTAATFGLLADPESVKRVAFEILPTTAIERAKGRRPAYSPDAFDELFGNELDDTTLKDQIVVLQRCWIDLQSAGHNVARDFAGLVVHPGCALARAGTYLGSQMVGPEGIAFLCPRTEFPGLFKILGAEVSDLAGMFETRPIGGVWVLVVDDEGMGLVTLNTPTEMQITAPGGMA